MRPQNGIEVRRVLRSSGQRLANLPELRAGQTAGRGKGLHKEAGILDRDLERLSRLHDARSRQASTTSPHAKDGKRERDTPTIARDYNRRRRPGVVSIRNVSMVRSRAICWDGGQRFDQLEPTEHLAARLPDGFLAPDGLQQFVDRHFERRAKRRTMSAESLSRSLS